MTNKRPRQRWLPVFASLAAHVVLFSVLESFYRIPWVDTRRADTEPAITVATAERVTFVPIQPDRTPGAAKDQRTTAYPVATNSPIVPPPEKRPGRPNTSEIDNSIRGERRTVGPPSVLVPHSRAVTVRHARSRPFILDSAVKDWTAEAERTRHIENPHQFGSWVATIAGRRYGLEPGWLRAGKVSVPLPPVYFIPEPYAYERQRDASWQRQDMLRQLRQRLIDSSVTAAAARLRSTNDRARHGTPP